MLVSHFLFRRGTDEFEVFVAKKWDEKALLEVKPDNRRAATLFLEEDDFSAGSDVFALDLFLMQKTGTHLDGKDLIAEIDIDKRHLRLCLEGEIRRLSAKARSAFYRKEQVPSRVLFSTLLGIVEGLQYLGLEKPIASEEENLLFSNIGSAVFPRKRTGALLALFQKWEQFLQKK